MCTVTWLSSAEGYEVFFNRDERRTRGAERPPQRSTIGGVALLAPRDGDFDGTWIAVNELGLALALLNGYGERRGPEPERTRSRGLLVLDLADAADARAVGARLHALELAPYEPFVLAAFEPGAPPLVARWDGQELARSPAPTDPPLLSSSGLDHERAERVRAAQLARLMGGAAATVEVLEAFCRSHGDGDRAVAPCMHRADAQTRSSCRISVDRDTVRLRHTPGPPCTTAPGPARSLPRRSRAGRSV